MIHADKPIAAELYRRTVVSDNVLGWQARRVYKNSSGDEIANVNFCTTTTYM